MPHNLLRQAITFFLPAGLLFMLMVLLSGQEAAAARLASLADIYYYVAVSFALLLGWRFDRSLLIFATTIIALGIWLLNHYGARGDATARIVADIVAVLLPLNLLLLTQVKERGIFTLHGLQRWGLILVQPPLIWLLFHYQRYDWLGVFDFIFITSTTLEDLRLHQPALLAFTITLVITGFRAIRHRNPLENAIFWAVALILYTLLQHYSSALTTALFSSALLILIVAVLEISYTMAFRDELTGLTGRRALNQALLKLGNRYTIAMLDIDHFKNFNDTYGHDVGDDALQMVAMKMSQLSGGGKVYRYGGEEFTAVFPGKGVEHATPHLEQLRVAIENSGFTVREKKRPGEKPDKKRKGSEKQVQITVSIGIAEKNSVLPDPEAVIKAADKALYKAKKAGRNRVAS